MGKYKGREGLKKSAKALEVTLGTAVIVLGFGLLKAISRSTGRTEVCDAADEAEKEILSSIKNK